MSNDSLLGSHARGLLFIVSAPAGTGKTTLIDQLVAEFPTVLANISYTTREPRDGELNGIHYHFITTDGFEAKRAASDFLECVNLYGTFYGSSKAWVEEKRSLGFHVVLVIDTQGALQLKGTIDAATIFISPPSLDELKKRLVGRKSESQETLQKRLSWAEKELEAAEFYDYQIINDDIKAAYEVLKSVIIAECHRTKKGEKDGKKG
ncbi:MAG: guanylate kinase [Parachlamydia sp.]|jgi:guanylate kinase|nr:guanylate kinase [Parachlamydia sp.]